MNRRSRLGVVTLLILGACLVSLQGCSGAKSFGQYAWYRYEDFCDMVDMGITLSLPWKPGFALYANGVGVLPGGFAHIDGYFLGIGGGQIGLKRYFFKSYGLIFIGHETIGWGEFDVNNANTLNQQGVGVGGILFGPNGMVGNVGVMGPGQGPDYIFACVHNLHLGWIGVVGNLRYSQAPDFLLGFLGLDPALDDGVQIGRWPWQGRRDETKPEEARAPAAPSDKPAATSTGAAGEGGAPRPVASAVPIEINVTITPVDSPSNARPLLAGEAAIVAPLAAGYGVPAAPREYTPAPTEAAANIETYVVRRGDTLYGMAKRLYGDGAKWRQLYEANQARLGLDSPRGLREGMVLHVPRQE